MPLIVEPLKLVLPPHTTVFGLALNEVIADKELTVTVTEILEDEPQ